MFIISDEYTLQEICKRRQQQLTQLAQFCKLHFLIKTWAELIHADCCAFSRSRDFQLAYIATCIYLYHAMPIEKKIKKNKTKMTKSLSCFRWNVIISWRLILLTRRVYSVSQKIPWCFLTFLPREATRSAVLPWQVVRLSVRLSVCDVEVSWSYRLEFCENNFTAD